MRPSVAILDSGDELVPLGKPVSSHQIPASNGAMLSWMLAPYIGHVDEQIGPVPDSPEALAKALARANDCHILITSGGASVGDHDHVQQWQTSNLRVHPSHPAPLFQQLQTSNHLVRAVPAWVV